MPTFTENQKQILRELARFSIEKELGLHGDSEFVKEGIADPLFAQKMGVFVTLHKNKQLRGCIGTLTPHAAIRSGVQDYAVLAALHDSRFPPVTPEELAEIYIEISILSDPAPLTFTSPRDLLQKLRPGLDGVTLTYDHCSATFLPQVWEQLPEPQLFLQHLALKAGLQPDDWQKQDVQIDTYTVVNF
ncbi:MAG: AmmeMemoRadiSam system protein A [Desulfobulbaceae bacterium]|jgi:AmmeMemoRadiSam system protein A|nr:AmmeMemoRadiSam system protein A [Desulfobulbaceae bacterium]